MPVETLLGQLFNLGFPAVIAVLIFFAYRDQNKALLEALQNNTRAMERLEGLTKGIYTGINGHDARAMSIGDCVDNIVVVTKRIDERTMNMSDKLDSHDKTLQSLVITRDKSA